MSKKLFDKNRNKLMEVYETDEIVANPELEGDEPELTGFQIGAGKYKMPEGGITEVDWDDVQNKPEFATVATSGDYSDLNGKPNLATVATSGSYNDLRNKPNLATVATSGNYSDLNNKPTIPTVNDSKITITQGGVEKGYFSTNQSTAKTINLDSGTEVEANPIIPSGVTPTDLENIKVGNNYYSIPEGGTGEVVEPTDTTKTKLKEEPYFEYLEDSFGNVFPAVAGDFAGEISFYSSENVWSDGKNIYYSEADLQYVFDKDSLLWIPKVWEGLNDFDGRYIWKINNSIFYSNGLSNDPEAHYVLNEVGRWVSFDWSTRFPDPVNFVGDCVWTDGDNVYYSEGSTQYVLELTEFIDQLSWSVKTWSGLIDFIGYFIWTDGDNIYYNNGNSQYVLNKPTSTWEAKTWLGLTNFDGRNIWTDGDNIYYSSQALQYILDKSTSTWSEKIWKIRSGEVVQPYSDHIWTDGSNIYYQVLAACILVKPKTNINSKPFIDSNIPCKVNKSTQPFLFSQIEFSEEKLNIEPENVKIQFWNLQPIFEGRENIIDEPLSMESTLTEIGEDVAIAILPKVPMITSDPWEVNDIQSVLTIAVKYSDDGSGGYICNICINDWNGTELWRYDATSLEIENWNLQDFINNLALLVDDTKESQPITYSLPQIVSDVAYNFTNSIIIYRAGINDYEIVRVKDVDKLIKYLIIDGNSASSSSSSSE